MKRSISIPAVVAIIVLVLAGLGVVAMRATASAPGPDPAEALKHMGPDSIKQAKAAGPPPGPPEPSFPSREEMKARHHPATP